MDQRQYHRFLSFRCTTLGGYYLPDGHPRPNEDRTIATVPLIGAENDGI